MRVRQWSGDPAMLLLWMAVALSFAFWPIVLWLGFDEPIAGAEGRYRTYFELANWWAFPFFFLALAPALWLTWEPLLKAWDRLAETEVLREGNGRPDADILDQVRHAVRGRRFIAVIGALVISLFINVVDRAPLLHHYGGAAGLAEQQAHACTDPGPFVKWILVSRSESEFLCDVLEKRKADGEPASGAPGIAPPPGQVLFAAVTTLQQVLIVFLAALAVLQVLLHTAMFGLLERLEVARRHGLRLSLNCGSPLNEFGLEHWNHALNNFYWAVCPAMLGVFISRAATPPEEHLPGQVMLGFAVPVCLLAPMVATIIVRQARLPEAWRSLQPNGPVAPEDYRRQQLWPLDRNWSSKLGILLAFALGALSIGFELSHLALL